MSSRELVLGRVRAALAPGRTDRSEPSQVHRAYLREHGNRSLQEHVELLAEHLADYRAVVHRSTLVSLPDLMQELLAGVGTMVTPSDLPAHYLASLAGGSVVHDRQADTPRGLDGIDAVVTGCAVAIAETGTIVLDGGTGQGRRRITLVPDHHVCIVRAPDQVVSSVSQALERLDPARPLTWISGPSATSDIEFSRVEGVHGPRKLDVVLLTDR